MEWNVKVQLPSLSSSEENDDSQHSDDPDQDVQPDSSDTMRASESSTLRKRGIQEFFTPCFVWSNGQTQNRWPNWGSSFSWLRKKFLTVILKIYHPLHFVSMSTKRIQRLKAKTN